MVDAFPDAPTAQALARLGGSRDPDAWRSLIENQGGVMYRAAYAVTRDEHLAEDACQEAFLLVRDGAHRFHPRGANAEAAAQGWLVRVATSTALMLVRRTRRRRRLEQERHPDASLGHEPSADGDEADALADALRSEIADLPAKCREALLLHAYAGMGYPEIATALGTSQGTVRMRVHRALERLRSRLGRAGASAAMLPITRPAMAAGPAPSPGTTAAWLGLLNAPSAPTIAAAEVFGGTAAGHGFAIAAGTLAATVCLALAFPLIRGRGEAARAIDPSAGGTAATGDLAGLPANTWIRVRPGYTGAPDGGELAPGNLNNVGVYDPASHRVIAFERWYDDIRRPESYGNALLAFDPAANLVTVLKVGNWRVVEFADHNETRPLPADASDPTPVDRQQMGNLALAPDFQQVFLANGLNGSAAYAGQAGNPITDTWSFDLGRKRWTKLSDERNAANPPGGQVMAYDPVARAVVLFVDSSFEGSQTWLLDPAAGTWRAVPRDPTCQAVHAGGSGIAYDTKRKRLLLFATAGLNLAPPSGQLWAYAVAENRWTSLADCPQATAAPGFTYDSTHDVFLALIDDATWVYDPGADAWSRIAAPFDRGGTHWFQSITYDPAHDVHVYLGGVSEAPVWALFRYAATTATPRP